MKVVAQRRDGATAEDLVDRVICHDVRDGAGRVAVAKGTRLDGAAAERLLGLPWDELHLIAPEAGDLHEEEAGQRLAAADSTCQSPPPKRAPDHCADALIEADRHQLPFVVTTEQRVVGLIGHETRVTVAVRDGL